MTGARWGISTLVAAAAKTTLIAGAFLFVAIYAHAIHPGEDAGYYEDFAQRYVPFFALVAGALLFFAAGRWLATRLGAAAKPTALGAWMIHSLLDIPVLLAHGAISGYQIGVTLTGLALFLIAILLGVHQASSGSEH